MPPAFLTWRGFVVAASSTPLLDRDVLADVAVQPTELGDALAALAAAVAAWRRRFARHAEAWTLIAMFTAGRLLTPI